MRSDALNTWRKVRSQILVLSLLLAMHSQPPPPV
jgi:hypothetical protein